MAAITLCFGRFRIIHAGHLSIFDQCDDIYISESSRQTSSLETAQELGYTSVYYARTIVQVLNNYSADQELVLLVGEDRASMVSLTNSYPNLRVIVIPRNEYSSTAARATIAGNRSLTESGLAVNDHHADLMIAQYTLEQ